MIEARELVVRYPGAQQPAVDGVSIDVTAGRLVAVAGPNGSGKSSLLRALVGLLPLDGGQVQVKGKALAEWPRARLATIIGVVSQREDSAFPLSVRESVMLGRYARLGPLGAERPMDHAAVDWALERCDVRSLASRRVDQLSGGEWQRVRVARALAQEPEALLLDEPTTSLDVRHEMELFELVASLAEDGLAALVITHGLNLAARFADQVLLLDRGRPVVAGPPSVVLTQEVVSEVFAWPVAVTRWRDGSPQIVPLRRSEAESGVASPISSES